MIRRLATSLSLLILALAPASGAVPDPAAELDAHAARVRADWEVPGLALAVVADGEVVLAHGYGVRELGSEEPVDADTLFAIGSTTKAMTAATLGLLVGEARLDWGDPVIEHWPGFRLADPWMTREVTVRDLLTHRAGLGNADALWYGSDLSRAEILARVPLIEPAYSPRAGFLYQNILYVAAGELAARLAETPWEELVERRLFEPLGMERTVPTTTAAELSANVARPHARVDGAVTPIENEILDAVAPAGAVWSSAREMARWLRMLLAGGELDGERVLPTSVVEEMLRPQTLLDLDDLYPYVDLLDPHWTSYGLGWFQLDYRGRAVSFHTGSIDGMAAVAGLVPDAGLGIVVLQNLDHAEGRHALLWKAIDLFVLGGPGRDWSAELAELYDERAREAEEREREAEAGRREGTAPSLPLERYAGTYAHPLFGDVRIGLEEGHLRLVAGPRLAADLEHWHHDTFQARFDRRWQGEALATFHLDAAGEPARLEIGGRSYRRTAREE